MKKLLWIEKAEDGPLYFRVSLSGVDHSVEYPQDGFVVDIGESSALVGIEVLFPSNKSVRKLLDIADSYNLDISPMMTFHAYRAA